MSIGSFVSLTSLDKLTVLGFLCNYFEDSYVESIAMKMGLFLNDPCLDRSAEAF